MTGTQKASRPGWEVMLERLTGQSAQGLVDHDEWGPVVGQWQEDPWAGRSWEVSAPHPTPSF